MAIESGPFPPDAVSALSLAALHLSKAAEAIRTAVSLTHRPRQEPTGNVDVSPFLELFGVAVKELEQINQSPLLPKPASVSPASTTTRSSRTSPATRPLPGPLSSPVSPKSFSLARPRRLSFAGSNTDTTMDLSISSGQKNEFSSADSAIDSSLQSLDLSIASSSRPSSPSDSLQGPSSSSGSIRARWIGAPSEEFERTQSAFRPVMVGWSAFSISDLVPRPSIHSTLKPSSSSLLNIPTKPSFLDGRYNRKRSASPGGRLGSRKAVRLAAE